MLGVAAYLRHEIAKEYKIVPKTHPVRALWAKLIIIMTSLGARSRATLDFVTEKNRGLKAMVDLKPGGDIMILPFSCFIK